MAAARPLGAFVDAQWRPHGDARKAVPYRAWQPEPIAEHEFRVDGELAERVERANDALNGYLADDRSRRASELMSTAEAVKSSAIERVTTSSVLHPMMEQAAPGVFHVDPASVPDISSTALMFLSQSDPELAASVFKQKLAAERATAVPSIVLNAAATSHAVTLTDVDAAPLTVDRICGIHAVLADGLPGYRHEPGVVRARQNWIGRTARTDEDRLLGPAASQLVSYVPPTPDQVEPMLDDLAAFCRRDDLSVIVRAAIAHARFEEIHPFPDGNGRTGRALAVALLTSQRTVLPISVSLFERHDLYLDALRSIGDVERVASDGVPFGAMIDVFADAVLRTAERAACVARWADAVCAGWQATAPLADDDLAANVLANLRDHPVVCASLLADRYDVSTQKARAAIRKLCDGQVLAEHDTVRRVKFYVAKQLLRSFYDEFFIAPGWVDMNDHYSRIGTGYSPLPCPADAESLFVWGEDNPPPPIHEHSHERAEVGGYFERDGRYEMP